MAAPAVERLAARGPEISHGPRREKAAVRYALIRMSTPAGMSSFDSASTVFDVGSSM
jgi:hypothetical protein